MLTKNFPINQLFVFAIFSVLLLHTSSIESAFGMSENEVRIQGEEDQAAAKEAKAKAEAEAKKKVEAAKKAKQEKKKAEKEAKEKKEKAEKKAEEESAISTESLKVETPEVDSRFLRFEMWDGTVVSGVVSIQAIDVDTEFGRLQIPIDRLIDFNPGLKSLPGFREKVDTLVEQLGDREFKTRENAHRELVGLGPMLTNVLPTLSDGGNAERKKHLVKIREEVQALMEEEEEIDEQSESRGITERDLIQTPDFSIAGKIIQEEFQVKSKIGDLRIMLSDVKRADRGIAVKAQTLRKTIYVAGDAFFQKKPVSTKIRVSKGDRISITATGLVQWTNWSQSASPEGLPNQGNWNGLANGSLAARIGDKGDIIGIGSDNTFTAEKSGILYLAVAIADNYANNNGYRWTGKFKTKVKVSPVQ